MPKVQPSFGERVKAIVKAIPPGETRSYLDVAKLAGKPKAARAVARLMSQNFDPSIPCHRVIKSNGEVGGYNRGGEKVKTKLLADEQAKHKV